MTIQEFLQGDKFALLAGVELLETASGYAKARMEIKPEHLNGGGVCQGGAIFTLADLAFAAATNSHARLTLSITSSINFFKAESKGYLYAEAHETFSHKRMLTVKFHPHTSPSVFDKVFDKLHFCASVLHDTHALPTDHDPIQEFHPSD